MPRFAAPSITLREAERTELQKRLRRRSPSQEIVLRAKIVLQANQNQGYGEITRELGTGLAIARPPDPEFSNKVKDIC